MNRWRALAACWLIVLASCGSDGGQRGTGITATAVAGNVVSVHGPSGAGVAGIAVSVEGTRLGTTTDATGGFALRGTFDGDTALVFERAIDGLFVRLPLSAPAGGRVAARDVELDVSTGSARPRVVEVAFEGRVEALACDDGRVTCSSVHGTDDDEETYDVVVVGSTLHDANGGALSCADLVVGDRLDVDGVFVANGAIGEADVTRR
jgi:hypothetical protein